MIIILDSLYAHIDSDNWKLSCFPSSLKLGKNLKFLQMFIAYQFSLQSHMTFWSTDLFSPLILEKLGCAISLNIFPVAFTVFSALFAFYLCYSSYGCLNFCISEKVILSLLSAQLPSVYWSLASHAGPYGLMLNGSFSTPETDITVVESCQSVSYLSKFRLCRIFHQLSFCSLVTCSIWHCTGTHDMDRSR